jgi:hypothetical protein
MREIIAKAIIAAFEEQYRTNGTDYDPDTCWAAADHVQAALVATILDTEVIAKHHPTIIGPAVLHIARSRDDSATDDNAAKISVN